MALTNAYVALVKSAPVTYLTVSCSSAPGLRVAQNSALRRSFQLRPFGAWKFAMQ